MRSRISSTDSQRGQTLVEFAITLPILIILLVGIVDGGRLVYVQNAISQAAREGARWGSVQGRSTSSGGRLTVAAETRSRMAAVPNSIVTVTCESGGVTVSSCGTNDILVVRVDTQVQLATPLLGQIFGTPTLSATSKVTVNQ